MADSHENASAPKKSNASMAIRQRESNSSDAGSTPKKGFMFSYFLLLLVTGVLLHLYASKVRVGPKNIGRFSASTKPCNMSAEYDRIVAIRKPCIAKVKNKILEAFEPSMKSLLGSKVVYIDPATHLNLGDPLLVLASVNLLKYYNKKIKFCRGPQTVVRLRPYVASCSMPEIVEFLEAGSPNNSYRNFIYYQPGGNWGDFYHKVQFRRLKILEEAMKKKLRVVSGPQTLHYENDTLARRDAAWIHAMAIPERLHLYWRQKSSFDAAEKYYGSSVTNVATSDTAFLLDVLKPENCLESTYDVVVHLRIDKESRFNLDEVSQVYPKVKDENYVSVRLCQFLLAKGIVRSCKPISWTTPSITQLDRERGMPEFLTSCLQQATGVVSLGRLVISDRLHGTLVSYLAGRKVLFIENKSNKTSGVFSTAFPSTDSQSPHYCMSEKAGILQATSDFEDIARKVRYLLHNA